MKSKILYRFFCAAGILLFCHFQPMAQSGFYVPKKGKIFFNGDTATIFSNVINHGKLGIGQKAVVNFLGDNWQNAPDAAITDESNGGDGTSGVGGLVRFIANDRRQQLDGGYNAAIKSGPMFHYFQLKNPFGLELTGSSAKVKGGIELANGLFYLQDQMLTIGHLNPGNITGYDSSRYFVTKRDGGLLIRENVTANDGWVAFPIGSKANAYTPASLRTTSIIGDDFYAAVFDTVRSGLTTDNLLIAESVGKTWQIGKRFLPRQGDVEIALQHLNNDEGILFASNKTKAYVAQFNGSAWDKGYPQSYPGIGYITSGSSLTNSGVNSRGFSSVSEASYFTKLTGEGDTTQTKLWFNAYRLHPSNVKVYWTTKPEINVKYFVVQRRFSNEATFKNIATVSSQALNGYSLQPLNYDMIDWNGYTGISFYRLMSVTYSRDSSYSQIVAVGNKAGEFNSELWPNPTTGIFNISINTSQPVKKIIIWNVLGQKVMEQQTGGQRVMQVNASKLAAANYYVTFIGMLNTIVETKKLIIAR